MFSTNLAIKDNELTQFYNLAKTYRNNSEWLNAAENYQKVANILREEIKSSNTPEVLGILYTSLVKCLDNLDACYSNIGEHHFEKEEPTDAAKNFQLAVDALREAIKISPYTPEDKKEGSARDRVLRTNLAFRLSALAQSHNVIADKYRKQKNWGAARDNHRKAIDFLRENIARLEEFPELEANRSKHTYQIHLAFSLANLFDCYKELSALHVSKQENAKAKFEKAEAFINEAMKTLEKIPNSQRDNIWEKALITCQLRLKDQNSKTSVHPNFTTAKTSDSSQETPRYHSEPEKKNNYVDVQHNTILSRGEEKILSPEEKLRQKLNAFASTANATYELETQSKQWQITFTGKQDSINQLANILRKYIKPVPVEQKRGGLAFCKLTGKSTTLVSLFENGKLFAEITNTFSSKTQTAEAKQQSPKIELQQIKKPAPLALNAELQEEWKKNLHAAFAYAQELKIIWNSSNNCFEIIIPATDPVKLTVRGHKDSHQHYQSYSISRERVITELVSRFQMHFDGSAEVLVQEKQIQKNTHVSQGKEEMEKNITLCVTPYVERLSPLSVLHEQIHAQISKHGEVQPQQKTTQIFFARTNNPASSPNKNQLQVKSTETAPLPSYQKEDLQTLIRNITSRQDLNFRMAALKNQKYQFIYSDKKASEDFFCELQAVINAEFPDAIGVFPTKIAGEVMIIFYGAKFDYEVLNEKVEVLKAKFAERKVTMPPSGEAEIKLEPKTENSPISRKQEKSSRSAADKQVPLGEISSVTRLRKQIHSHLRSLSEIDKRNVDYHIKQLMMIPAPTEEHNENAVYYFMVYSLHALRLFEILARQTHNHSNSNSQAPIFYLCRNIVRHCFKSLDWAEFHKSIHPLIESIGKFKDCLDKQPNNRQQFFPTIDILLEDKDIAEFGKWLAPYQLQRVEGRFEEVFDFGQKDAIESYAQCLEGIQASKLSEEWKRDATLMLWALIKEKNVEYRNVSRHLGHEGFHHDYIAFADGLYMGTLGKLANRGGESASNRQCAARNMT